MKIRRRYMKQIKIHRIVEYLRTIGLLSFEHPMLKRINKDVNSYQIKHWIEAGIGFYVSNQEVIKAFKIMGFDSVNANSDRKHFNISKKQIKHLIKNSKRTLNE